MGFRIENGILVEYIEEPGVTEVVVPDGIKIIGEFAFSCSGLVSITLPNSITDIDEGAFQNCPHLTTVILPENITWISDYLFDGCENLKSVVIPEQVTYIGDMAFFGCCSLTSVVIPEKVRTIDDWAFACCQQLTSITIPASVTRIGENAFWKDRGEKLTIRAPRGSYAIEYAKQNGIAYEEL